jgi:hypothetical protein
MFVEGDDHPKLVAGSAYLHTSKDSPSMAMDLGVPMGSEMPNQNIQLVK